MNLPLQPLAQQLIKLGARKPKRLTLADVFGVRKTQWHPTPDPPVKPDVDYHPEEERKPQAPHFTGMWLDHWSHWGDVKNPIGSPMESGA
ncbi:MAG TPA: hypothetical protein VGL38_05935 [bacterium]